MKNAWQDPNPETIQRLLQGPKPGLEAQRRMAPQPRPGWLPGNHVSPRQGSGLILLYPHRREVHLVLTRRSENLGNHRGQISLPGGRRETGESAEQAALRETSEELGVPPLAVRILGQLTPLYIPPSDFCLTPVVGWTDARPVWSPDPVEVAEVLEVSLRCLADPTTRHEKTESRYGATVQIPFFLVTGHHVWGATAMILEEFLEVLRAGEHEPK
ncbi:MAG: NUDIX hydrolase [Chloroflexota bacterium]